MTYSEILNILLGGGLLATLLGVITLKAAVRKANAEAVKAQAEAAQAQAEAKKAEADAETVRITNTENATRILVENIVRPLKDELNATREELQATKKEMASTKRTMSRLAKAVEAVNDCRHVDDCPVRRKLRLNQEIGTGDNLDSADNRNRGHDNSRDQGNPMGECAPERSDAKTERGQPA
ncbi:MAG: hypothetical protein K1V80_06790 [Muribaculaceae bacterium]